MMNEIISGGSRKKREISAQYQQTLSMWVLYRDDDVWLRIFFNKNKNKREKERTDFGF